MELLDWDERGGRGAGAVYIYFITAAGNSISSQLGSSCQASRYGTEKAGVMVRPSSKAGRVFFQPSRLRRHCMETNAWVSFRWGGGGGEGGRRGGALKKVKKFGPNFGCKFN